MLAASTSFPMKTPWLWLLPIPHLVNISSHTTGLWPLIHLKPLPLLNLPPKLFPNHTSDHIPCLCKNRYWLSIACYRNNKILTSWLGIQGTWQWGCRSLQPFNCDPLFCDACNAPVTLYLSFCDLTPFPETPLPLSPPTKILIFI